MDYNKIFSEVRTASRALAALDEDKVNAILRAVADAAVRNTPYILEENAKDLAQMDAANPLYDRLLLTKERIEGIASDIRNVASLPSPLGKLLSETVRPNGIRISKICFSKICNVFIVGNLVLHMLSLL